METRNRKTLDYTVIFYTKLKGFSIYPIQYVHFTTPRDRSSLSLWYNINPMSLFRIDRAYYRPLFLIRSESSFDVKRRLLSFCDGLDISVYRDQNKVRESLIEFFNKDFSDIPMFKLWHL